MQQFNNMDTVYIRHTQVQKSELQVPSTATLQSTSDKVKEALGVAMPPKRSEEASEVSPNA